MSVSDIQNPFYDKLPQTLNLFGDAPMSEKEIQQAYRNNTICGAITQDSDQAIIRRIAAYDEEAITEMMGGENNAYYENSEAFKQPCSMPESEDCWFPFKTYIFEDRAKAMKGSQLTGDCTSWMVRLMLMLTLIQRLSAGNLERYIKRLATAPYYANRGHRGQGSNPWRQCSYASEIGYVFEQVYGSFDLTDYKSYYRLGISWGNGPIPKTISDVSSQVRPSKPLRIRSLEGWLDANRKRYPWGLGSSMGVSDRGNPVSKLQGSWNHAMGGAGYDARPVVREKYGVDVLAFMDQSWGLWNRVDGLLPEWQPFGEGMFILNYKSLERYIDRGECIVYVPDDSQGFEVTPPKFLGNVTDQTFPQFNGSFINTGEVKAHVQRGPTSLWQNPKDVDINKQLIEADRIVRRNLSDPTPDDVYAYIRATN